MLSEIGSNFWIDPNDLKVKYSSEINLAQFGCVGNDYALFSTGRSAISYVLDTIEFRNPNVKKVVLLPPFTCHTVIEPFLAKNYEVRTFHVGKDLSSSVVDLLDVVDTSQVGVILFHRFFGFDTIKNIDSIIPSLRREGVIVIEDCTQCLYSRFSKSDADYFVGSIRKWCGVPDGGFAVCREGNFSNKPTEMDEELQEAKKEASIHKYKYLFEGKGEKSFFLDQYRKAEDILIAQKQYFTISDLSKLIQGNLDVSFLKAKRRANYEIVSRGLSRCDGIKVIFETLNDDVVPLYCPILCNDRQYVQKELVKNNIYAPVVWPKADCCSQVDEDTDYIYEHILCIPIDQRYDVDDMERILTVFKCN